MGDAYIEIIRNTRVRFGEPPRTFSSADTKYLQVAPPAWCREGKDELYAFYRDHQFLMRHGTVAWGVLLQANTILFAPGPHDAPGAVAHCAEPHWHDDLRRLSDIGKQLSNLKDGSGQTPKEKEIGALLADEAKRFMAHPVPKTIAGEAPLLIGVTMFIRKHLPGRVLSTGYFPVLIHDDVKSVSVLPARYWDAAMVDIWMSPR
jgi:hypothetical protein